MDTNPGVELREIHSRELPNRNLHPQQFGEAGQRATSIGARSLNRTGGIGGTSSSADAHHVAGAGRDAALLVQDGEV
jgi:hypothetical protein